MNRKILGKDLITSTLMVEFFRKPVSKKKRIIKKWSKRKENWRPMRQAFVTETSIIIHPSLLRVFNIVENNPLKYTTR